MTSENDTTKTMPDFIDIINNVHGFISLPEMELLYALASQVPSGGNIVEIGSYQGRSTISLALGAKVNGAIVWAIDPHPTYEDGGTQYGMADNQAYCENIAKYQVGDVVRTLNIGSFFVTPKWIWEIDVLFIDARHEYEYVKDDFVQWNPFMMSLGKVAFHDTAGHHPGVTQLVNEILAAGQWKISQQVDAISVLERVK